MNNKSTQVYIYKANKKAIAVFLLYLFTLFGFLVWQANINNNTEVEFTEQSSQNITATEMPVISMQSLQPTSSPIGMTPILQQEPSPLANSQLTQVAQIDLSPLPTYSAALQLVSPINTLQPLSTSTQLSSPTNIPQSSSTPTSQPSGLFTGTGNQIVDVGSWQEPLIISFFHNDEGAFKAISRDTSNEPVGTLVEATGPYEGRQVINAGGVQYSAIEIQTNGSWQLEIQLLDRAILLELPITINGKNAEVYRLDKMIYELSFDASSASGWVSIIGYGENNYVNVLVNAQAPFLRTITVKDPDIIYLEVVALGKWVLEVK